MAAKTLGTILAVATALQHSHGHSHGAPMEACRTMNPKHNTFPQENFHPYRLTAERTDNDVVLTLWSQNKSVRYRGFFIRAVQKKGHTESYFQGHFIRDSRSPTVNFVRCGQHDANAVTHQNNELKSTTVVRWAPNTLPIHPAIVTFRATIVQSKMVYWMKLESSIILVGSATSWRPMPSLAVILPMFTHQIATRT